MSAKQRINMNETGNVTRPEKGRRKLLGCSWKTTIEGHYQDCKDDSHVFLVSTSSLSGEALKLLLLRIAGIHCNDVDLEFRRGGFLTDRRPKGYMINISMVFYLREVSRPYSKSVAAKIGEPKALSFENGRPEWPQ
jgi:hypothetical protein